MATEDQILLVHAYLDGELDPANSLAMKERIEADPDLAREFSRAEAVATALGRHIPREEVTEAFRRRIAGMTTTPPTKRWQSPTWTALAASVVLAIGLGGSSAWLALRIPAAYAVQNEVIDSHVRSLMASTPTDILSSDRHTVKPWFNGRISQAPRVVDLADVGYPLVGARIDVVSKTPVPTLVYKRRQHVISLVALPASISDFAYPATRNESGYNSVQWAQGSNAFFATSDLNAEELNTFAKLFREAPG